MMWILTMLHWILEGLGILFLLLIIYPLIADRFFGANIGNWIRLGVTPETRTKLENLRVLSEKTSAQEIVVYALATYECLWQEVAKGGRVIFRYEDGTERSLDLK